MNIFSAKGIVAILATIFIYFIIPKKIQKYILLLISLAFYLSSDYKNIFYLLSTSILIYFAAYYFDKLDLQYQDRLSNCDKETKKVLVKQKQKKKKIVLTIVIILNIGVLAYFKYVNTFISIFSKLFNLDSLKTIELILPLGISFYTFQAIGYLIDVYRGQISAEKSYLNLLLFLSYFPQVIQGPIGRYKDLMPQLIEHNRFNYNRTISALMLILWGYFKKLIIAEGLGYIVDPILATDSTYQGMYVFLGVFLYAIQIYADFSGGIEIISGISEILGIQLAKNFERPFFAKSLDEFWRRWHMTLGSWMRDYVFYPVTFSPLILKFNRWIKKKGNRRLSKLLPSAVSSMVVFFCVGIWHGSSIKYIAFGLYNGIIITFSLLMAEKYGQWKTKLGIQDESFSWKSFQIFRTILLTTIGRYFTRATSFRHAISMFKSTFSTFNPYVLLTNKIFDFGLSPMKIFILGFSIFILFQIEFVQERGIDVREKLMHSHSIVRILITSSLLFYILLFGFYGAQVDVSNFIYQGF